MVTLNGAWGWTIFGLIWAQAIAGVLFKLFWYKSKHRKLSALTYVLMGLTVFIAVYPLFQNMSPLGFAWIMIGNGVYIAGVFFYLAEKTIPFSHGIFHLFVLGGSFPIFLGFTTTFFPICFRIYLLTLDVKEYSGGMRLRPGFLVLSITVIISIMGFFSVLVLYRGASDEYRLASQKANHQKAKYLAQSGLEASIMILKKIPIDLLYTYNIIENPPPLPIGNSIVTISISEETGKVNLNRLVHFFDDEVDLRNREILDRLSENLGISYRIWDGVIDWIDENSTAMPSGAEKFDYEAMNPPRTIKNGRMHDLSELLLIPGISTFLLYQDIRPETEKEKVSSDFATEKENFLKPEDFILANHLSVYLPENVNHGDKININSAPYHVILSLSEFMTKEAALAILKERSLRGRIKNVSDLSSLSELDIPSVGGVTLFQEIENRISTDDILYKIVAEASFLSQTAHVIGVYSNPESKIVYYSE